MSDNGNQQRSNEQEQQEQTAADTPINDESGEGATDGSGTAKGDHDEQPGYEGGALGSAGSGTSLKEDKAGSDRGTTFANSSTEEGNTPLTPGTDDSRDYEGGALGSAGSGTGALDENDQKSN